MIITVSRSASSHDVAIYISKGLALGVSEFIDGTLTSEWDNDQVGDIVRFSNAFIAQRPDILHPITHISISLHPTDGKKSREVWSKIVSSFLQKIDFPCHDAWVAYRHHDRPHDHIHLMLIRVLAEGKLWDESFSGKRAQRAAKEIEKEFELFAPSRITSHRKGPTRGEFHAARKNGGQSTRETLQTLIDKVVDSFQKEGFTLEQLELKLRESSVAMIRVHHQERSGLVFQLNEVSFGGASLGSGYTIEGLTKRGLSSIDEDSGERTPHGDRPRG